ncbi:hypothetical protein AB0N09_30845 [Streptomyces erythrochromogenes]|uniref:hypothetical protein n=1 Tax=Streptomyces erythrochromogenes TaxID=285574 RepID=UPI0034286342
MPLPNPPRRTTPPSNQRRRSEPLSPPPRWTDLFLPPRFAQHIEELLDHEDDTTEPDQPRRPGRR